jgi:hypothetical protein
MSGLVGMRIASGLVFYVVMEFCERSGRVEKGGEGEVEIGCVWMWWDGK